MSADGLPPLRDVIERHGLQARKALGQNFLLDLNLTGKVARAAGDLSQVTVIEVGPGPGGLTRALLMHGAQRVVAIERDERCLAALAEIAARYPGRLEVISGDALKTDFAALAGGARAKIVANLPYNLGTELLVRWLPVAEWPPFYHSLTLMFQREVAERIVARPGDEAYGGSACWPVGAPRRGSCSTCLARPSPTAAQGHVLGGASRPACGASASRRKDARPRPPRRPSASAARCCGKASRRSAARTCWRGRRSTPPAGRRH